MLIEMQPVSKDVLHRLCLGPRKLLEVSSLEMWQNLLYD